MAHRYMKKYSRPLAIRAIQAKNYSEDFPDPVRMADM